MCIYFILCIIVKYDVILLLKLFQLGFLETHSSWFCVPLTYYIHSPLTFWHKYSFECLNTI